MPEVGAVTARDDHHGLDLYRWMALLRAFDRAAAAAYRRGEIHGTYRGGVGQEAISVGVCRALRDGDYLFAGLRGIGAMLAKGIDPRRLMAELYGKSTGVSGGRGGAFHLADRAHGIMGSFAVMAAAVPMAAGTALAAQLRCDQRVTACLVGDRETNEGVFHESMNIAALLGLPVLYVAVNNGPDDAHNALRDHTAAGSLASLAAVHGIPAETIDGTDALEVYDRAAAAVTALRSGRGPWFLECRSFPLDEASRAQVEAWQDEMRRTGSFTGMLAVKKRNVGGEALAVPPHWQERDPLRVLARRLLADGSCAEADLQAIDVEATRTVDDAVDFAGRSAEPAPETAQTGVYAGGG